MIVSASVMLNSYTYRWMILLLAAFAAAATPAYAKPKTSAKKAPLAAKQLPAKVVPDTAKDPESVAKELVGKKLGFWVSGIAKVSTYAYVARDDSYNRIMCLLTMTFNTECFYRGESKENVQLVHVLREGDNVEVNEVETIDKKTGGIYVLFMPDTLYILDFEADSFVRYAKR